MRKSHWQWVLVLALGATANASAALPPITDARPMQTAPGAVSASGMNTSGASTLERRVAKLERLMENQALIDMMIRLDVLQSDIQTFKGDSEMLVHQIKGIKSRQRDLYMDVDRRIRQLEERIKQVGSNTFTPEGAAALSTSGEYIAPATTVGGSAVPAPNVSGAGGVSGQQQADSTTASEAKAAVEPVNPMAEQRDYQQAFDVLKERRYEAAIVAFQRFIEDHPRGQYLANAYYWMGEANYVTRRFPAAIKAFNHVVKGFPQSAKVPDAMLKIGFTHYEMKAWKEARAVLENIIKKHPNSTAAQLAEKRLRDLKIEGH